MLTLGGALLVVGSLVYGALALRDVQARKQQLEQDVIAKSDEVTILVRKVDALTTSQTQLEQAIATKTAQIDQLMRQEATVQQETATLKKQVAELLEQLRDTEEKLETLEAQLRESASFSQYVHKVSLGTAKYLLRRSERLSRLLSAILDFQEQGLPFGFHNTADNGFTSPAFAGFILQKVTGGPPTTPPEAVLTRLEAAA